MGEFHHGRNQTVLTKVSRAGGVCIGWADLPAYNPSPPPSSKQHLAQLYSRKKEGRFIQFTIGSLNMHSAPAR